MARSLYSPAMDFNGVDSFVYEICDIGGKCDSATVTVTVLAVNDAPVATADVYETDEDVELVIESPGVLANDDDVDGDALAAELVGQALLGVVELGADGSVRYVAERERVRRGLVHLSSFRQRTVHGSHDGVDQCALRGRSSRRT